MNVTCPKCGKALSAEPSPTGRVVKCPACGGAVAIPGTGSAVEAPGKDRPDRRGHAPTKVKQVRCTYCGNFIPPGHRRCPCREQAAAAGVAELVRADAERGYALRMQILGGALLVLGGLALLTAIIVAIVTLARNCGGGTGFDWIITSKGTIFCMKMFGSLAVIGLCAWMGVNAVRLENWVNWAVVVVMGLSEFCALWPLFGGAGRVTLPVMLVLAAPLALAVSNIVKYRQITAVVPPPARGK